MEREKENTAVGGVDFSYTSESRSIEADGSRYVGDRSSFLGHEVIHVTDLDLLFSSIGNIESIKILRL